MVKRNKTILFTACAVAVLVGTAGFFYYRQANEDRRLHAYVDALEGLAQVLEDNAKKGPEERDGKQLRDAVDRCRLAGASFAKVPAEEMPRFLERNPDLARALNRMNLAMASVDGAPRY